MSDLAKPTNKLPTLNELYNDTEMMSKYNDLNMILNAEPKKEWLKQHPTVKVKDSSGNSVPLKYIPIERIEYLLTSIFIKWRVEIKSSKLIANSVVVEVRLYVLDPISNQWDWQDGIGASPIQIKANSGGAIDFSNMQSSAIQMAAPSAESYAISDAADKFGKIFGKDLNRAGAMNYSDMQAGRFNVPTLSEDAIAKIIQAGKSGEVGMAQVLEQLKKPFNEEQKQFIRNELKINDGE